jgi:mannosyl-3-phosphoglycerate phosphatase
MRQLVFSDLDGTFLNHHTYRYDSALPTLLRLVQRDIPCIWNTSKTYAELIVFRDQLIKNTNWQSEHSRALNAPFIVENGAAVFLPMPEFGDCASLIRQEDYMAKPFSPALPHILETLQELKQHYRFKGFSSMSVEEVIDCTGLDRASALLARKRAYTEPLLWLDSPERLADFTAELQDLGIVCRHGGRFIHASGQHDKGTAMQWVKALYEKRWGVPVETIALGDGHNDVPMLELADIAVVLPAANGTTQRLQTDGRILQPSQPGPEGWVQALGELLDDY